MSGEILHAFFKFFMNILYEINETTEAQRYRGFLKDYRKGAKGAEVIILNIFFSLRPSRTSRLRGDLLTIYKP